MHGAYQLAAEQLAQMGFGQGDMISLQQVEALRLAPPNMDWRKKARPKSASYMRPRCRLTPDGGGGAPLTRPTSAPVGRRPAPKTERWRESGLTRWPKESAKTHHRSDPSDGDPLKRGPAKQPHCTGELWTRSLRRPGLEIQDPTFQDAAQRGVREMHEEWQEPRPMPAFPSRRPHSARAGSSQRGICRTGPAVPYSGSTAIGEASLPRKHNVKDWIERPVATGTMSLTHHAGQRYTWDQKPRPLEWKEYLKSMDQ